MENKNVSVLTTELRVIDGFSQTFNKASHGLKKLKNQFMELRQITSQGLDFKINSNLEAVQDLTKGLNNIYGGLGKTSSMDIWTDKVKKLTTSLVELQSVQTSKLQEALDGLNTLNDLSFDSSQLSMFSTFVKQLSTMVDTVGKSDDVKLGSFARYMQEMHDVTKELDELDNFNKFSLGMERFSKALNVLGYANKDLALSVFRDVQKLNDYAKEFGETKAFNNFSIGLQKIAYGIRALENVDMNKALSIFKEFKTLNDHARDFVKADNFANFTTSINKLAKGLKNLETTNLKGIHESLGNVGSKLTTYLQKAFGVAKSMYKLSSDTVREFGSYFAQEIKLKLVLDNNDLKNAFDELKNVARGISKQSILPESGMMAAAAEISRYFKDTAAIKKLLQVLPDYAYGLTEDVANLTPNQLKNYARDLAKMSNDMYSQMSRRGFKITESQKNILKGTASEVDLVKELGTSYRNMSEDMRKAQVIQDIVSNNWGGLANAMNKTPQAISESIKQSLTALRVEFGREISGGWTEILKTVKNHLDGLVGPVKTLGKIFNDTFIVINDCFKTLSENLGKTMNQIVSWFEGLDNLVEDFFVGLFGWWATASIFFHNMWQDTKKTGASIGKIIENYGKHEERIEDYWLSILPEKYRKNLWLGEAQPNNNDSTTSWEKLINDFKKLDDDYPKLDYKDALMELTGQIKKYFNKRRTETQFNINDVTGKYTGIDNDYDTDEVLRQIKEDTGKIAKTVEDDFSWLREFTEQEYINKFTTAEIKIDVTNNNSINSALDLDGITNELTEKLREAVNRSVNGFYSY